MPTDIPSLIFLVGLALLLIYFQVILIRLVFQIPKQISIQKAQLDLLVKLCEKQGVAVEELNNIIAVHKV